MRIGPRPGTRPRLAVIHPRAGARRVHPAYCLRILDKERGDPFPVVKGTLDVLVLKALSHGQMHGFEMTRWLEARLDLRPMRLIAAGLLLALITGAGAWAFGHPFLTSHTAHVRLPLVGELHVPTALMFDLGVFSLVVGATGLLLIALAHQSIRSHRAPRQT